VTKQNLLVVDADPRSLRVLEVSLRNAGYNVAGCPSVGKALEILHANKPDLILSDTTFSDLNGFEFVEQLRQNSEWSHIPFMFLSSDESIESKIRGLELGVEDYLTKPIYIREVVARVGIELARQARAGLAHKSSDARTRFSGSLSEMSVVDLLQTIDVSRKSGVLTLVSTDGQAGMISFDSGAVINATVEELIGEDAVYRHLLWSDGTFDLEFRRVSLSERTVHRTTQALLMEGMRRLDEWSRLSELLPSFDAVLEVDAEILRERLRDMPDDQNEMVRLIDGKKSVGELLRAHGGDHVEALRKVVDLYFEGMVREVGRVQDSIPILTEISVRSSAPPPKEGINTIPGPAGLPLEGVAVPAAPRLPEVTYSSTSVTAPEMAAVSGSVPATGSVPAAGPASVPAAGPGSVPAPTPTWVPASVPPSDMESTPVSLPSPATADDLALEHAVTKPSGAPAASAPPSDLPSDGDSGWQPAPPPARTRQQTPAGFQAVRPESSMYAGGTILNWAGRVPAIDESEDISGRETVEVGQWDSTLGELCDDPEVEEAIVAIDSDPPPGPFIRSTPPSNRPIDAAVERGEEQQREPIVDYHEPPEVDPPPLTYEKVFEQEAAEASIRAPRAVRPSSIAPRRPAKPTMLPWALLVLAIGGAVAALAYLFSPGGADTAADTAAGTAADTAAGTAAGTAADTAAGTGTAADTAADTAAGTAAGTATVAGTDPDPAPDTEPAPAPNPDAIFPETGAVDTYEAQLALARRLKRGARASAAYRRAIELNPEGSPALAEFARLMLARNHTREAAELAERATAVDPTNALAWVTLGAARQMRGDRQGARQAYQNCAKLGKGQYVSECRAMLR
jgi:DNA-binding response OmpR family regulator